MKQSQKSTLIIVLIGVLVFIGVVVLWNMNHNEAYDSNPWESGVSLGECERNYQNCMDMCSMQPSIGCPGQCLEEKEYCQEFSRNM